MKIAILQSDICWSNIEVNLQHFDSEINAHPGADIYVLPEMFSTGFCTEPRGIAETSHGVSLQWMLQKSAAIDAAIAGSVAVEDNGEYHNRFYFVQPNGKVDYYDKKHLFTYGGEHHRFTAGKDRVVVEFRGLRILLLVCYDLRFPVWSRNLGDYDAAFYVASWPTSRVEAWKTLLRARAIENQCYVVGVNRIGEDPSCSYCGGSGVVDPYGQLVVACEDHCAATQIAEINLDKLQAFREKFPVLGDADGFTLK